MTSHIQRLYAKIQANQLNDEALREQVKKDRERVKEDDNLITLILFGHTILIFLLMFVVFYDLKR